MPPPKVVRYILSRDVSVEECDWLDKDFKKGDTVYGCTKHTYGCIDSGIACTLDENGDYPFFELPWDALDEE